MQTLSEMMKSNGAVKSKGEDCKDLYAELLKKRREDNKQFNEQITSRKDSNALESIIGRSGIMPLHQGCTINNFIATTPEQAFAKKFASDYIVSFGINKGCGFIFSGTSGTGKNHLSAAICNNLMQRRKSCLIITVSELMIKMRKCYGKDPEYSEDQFIQNLINFDLLVLDEIGLQRGSDNEKLVLNQVIDQRISHFKPTGMLTNLNAQAINDILGVRIMDRMRMSGGAWVPFEWASYRK